MTVTIPSVKSITDSKREDTGNESQVDHKAPIDDPAVQIVIAVCCALFVSVIIFTCAICLRRRRNAIRRKSSLGHFFIGLDGVAPFGLASLNSQVYRSRSEDDKDDIEDTNYNTFTYSEEYPQEEFYEQEFSDRSSTPSSSEIHDSSVTDSPQSDKSSPHLGKISTVKKLRMMRRAKSLGNLTSGLASGVIHRSENETTMTFCLEYHQENSVLNVDIQDVFDLPPRVQSSEVYITAHLFPVTNDGINTKTIRADEIAHFNEIVQFRNVGFKCLEHSTLRLSLFSKKKTKSKASFVGEAFVQCSEINLASTFPTKMEVILQKKRLKKHSTADKHLNRNLGEVFVLLQYNSMANRMKVFIRRAEHLPKSDRLLGQPVHYIILNIYKEDELIMTKETKTQSGYTPVWNQPFLFDIPNSTVSEHSLELVVMRGRRHTKDGVIGRVVIGKQGSKSGSDHWQEMIRPSSREVAKWHNILPVFRFE